MSDFRKITSDFCTYYYNIWNTNPILLKDLFEKDPRITHSNKEFISFDSYLIYLQRIIMEMKYLNYQCVGQLLGKYHILINVIGTVNINEIVRKFNETIVLHKDLWEKYHITNSIIRFD